MIRKFLATAGFELRYYLKRISTWVYFGIFFIIPFLLMNANGGAWDSVSMSLGGSGGNIHANSPYVIATIIAVTSIFGVIITAALLGNSVYRDYEARIHPLFFTSPISRFSYLGGRFVGALLVNAIIMLALPLGTLLGSVMPYLDQERMGPTMMAAHVQPYLVFVLPTLLFTGAIFFALAAYTRQMLPNYLGAVALIAGYMLAGQFSANMENRNLAAMLDPFGGEAFGNLTKYWSPIEKNTLIVPFEDWVLWNRLLWMGIGLTIFAIAYARFRFSHAAAESTRRSKKRVSDVEDGPVVHPPAAVQAPSATQSFGWRASLQQYLVITKRSFLGIVMNRYFAAIVGAGVLFLVIGSTEVGKSYGTSVWPVTYSVVETLGGLFSLFVLIIITLYAGDLVWRERDVELDQVHDATPVRNWVPFTGKLTALALVIVVLQSVILVAGILTQAAKGYYNFEIGLYAKSLFGFFLADYILLAALVMLIHVLVNNKYMGHMVVILYFVATLFLPQFGLEHNLYNFGSDAGRTYSDMNGFGPFTGPFVWFKMYWAAWALLFAVLSNLFWVRGRERGAKWRVRLARMRFSQPAVVASGVAALLIFTLGGFLFYNTNVLNEFETSRAAERDRAEYERLYKRFEGVPQPRVTGVNLHVEIYPEERDVEVRGSYSLVNKTDVAIDSLHMLLDSDIEIRALEFDRPAERVLNDEDRGYNIYHLARPLQPGESLRMTFDLAKVTRGFGNRVADLDVVRNGTFFNSGVLPSFGYNPQYELSADDTRRKHDLQPKERARPVDDPEGLKNTYISQDADWIDFEAVVGTAEGQIALAPGYLQREWTEDGRHYFHYKMDAPILNFYSFLSAEYEIARDSWNDVAIEVYYHPGHEYNVQRMIDAVKKSLDYFTENFGPYQHRQVRILEFPRYAAFAQAFPNTIPYSEAIGFIARLDDEEAIDYPFYITAHEVAHQWWAHQVIGGAVQGATVLSETLSQYSALMVMEEEYGREHMRRFLEYELDQYLMGRSFERKKERPLLLVENQQYIHYNKGSVVMYALRDYIGEDRLNEALAAFLEDKKFQEAPYTNTLEFYEYLEAATPDSLRPMLNDLFREITLWDLRGAEATAQPTGDGEYQVTLRLEARKIRADSLGNETEVELNDPIDIGVFGPAGRGEELGEPLYLEKHRITSGEQTITVTVPSEPARAGVDPYHKLIDRHTDDNTVAVTN